MNVIKAIYNFVVGDMVILVGVIITVVILALISTISALSALKVASGYILVIAALIIITVTLYRETHEKK